MNSMSRRTLKEIVDAHGMASVLEALSRIADQPTPASPERPERQMCGFSSNGYTCTLLVGHLGDHRDTNGDPDLTACGSYRESLLEAGTCSFCGYSRPAHASGSRA